jgi:hypothetical protein
VTGLAATGATTVATTDVTIGPVAAVDISAINAAARGGMTAARPVVVDTTVTSGPATAVATGGMIGPAGTVVGIGVMIAPAGTAVGIGTRGRVISVVATTGMTGRAIHAAVTGGTIVLVTRAGVIRAGVTRVGVGQVGLVAVGRRVGSVERSGAMTAVGRLGGTIAVGTGGTSAPPTTVAGTAGMIAATRVEDSGGMTVRASLAAADIDGTSAPATPAVDTTVMTGAVPRVGVGGTIGGDQRVVMSGVAGLGGRTARRRPGHVGTTRRFRKASRVLSSIVV